MLLLVRLVQKQAVGAVRYCELGALVGPTSPLGWTAIWSPRADQLIARHPEIRYVAIDEVRDGLRLRVSTGTTGDRLQMFWSRRAGAAGDGIAKDGIAGDGIAGDGIAGDGPAVTAAALAQAFECPERQQALAGILGQVPDDADELAEWLDVVLDLPELIEPVPPRAVLAHRTDRESVALTARSHGPVRLLPAVNGWSIVQVPAGRDPAVSNGMQSLTFASALSAADRSGQVLLLWRDGGASGLRIWAHEQLVLEWSWNSGWLVVEPAEDADLHETEAIRSLTSALGAAADESRLRDLLHQRRTTQDPLAELVAQFGLPALLPELLDHPEHAVDGELMERESLLKSFVRRLYRRPEPEVGIPRILRILEAMYAVATVMAGAVCLLMTILSIAVLVTDGRVVNQDGIGLGDWLSLLAFIALSVVLLAIAVLRVRRVLLRRRQTLA